MPRLPRKGSRNQSRQQKHDLESDSAADDFGDDLNAEELSSAEVGSLSESSFQCSAAADVKHGKGNSAPSAVPACLSHSAGYLMNYNARIIRERLESALLPLHLSLRELGIMRILESEGPLLQNELGKRQGIDRTSVVQLIDQLEKREFVQRAQNRDDRRSKFLFLTPRGRKTLSQALRLVEKEQRIFLAPLAPQEWETMRLLLLKLLSAHLSEETREPNGL